MGFEKQKGFTMECFVSVFFWAGLLGVSAMVLRLGFTTYRLPGDMWFDAFALIYWVPFVVWSGWFLR